MSNENDNVEMKSEELPQNGVNEPDAFSSSFFNVGSSIPAQVERHLDFVTANKEGHIVLGSSNLTGRYWNGSVWYFRDPADAPLVDHCVSGYELNAGVVDGIFLDGEKTVIVGLDSGHLEFLNLTTESQGVSYFHSWSSIQEHEDAILSVAVTCDSKSALTASADKSIRVWDCDSTVVTRCLFPAHCQSVTNVSPHPTSPEMFLSASLDGNVLLWDLRQEKPASCLYRDLNDRPTCTSWICENRFLVGKQSGGVVLHGVESLGEDLAQHSVSYRPVFRLKTNPTQSSLVGVCCNDSVVQIIEVEDCNIQCRYEDDRHGDFVRGLAWTNERSLVSCGWDKTVLTHII